jgi:hypothetical protein
MTQVLQHDYGKSKITLLQIRAAIKAVKAEKSLPASDRLKTKTVVLKKADRVTPTKSRSRA